jgi:hypothetical protein
MSRKHIFSLAGFLLLAISADQALSQVGAPLPCEAPPQGASEEVKQCYDNACEIFQKAYSDCDTPQCRNIVKLEYAYALNQCLPLLIPPVSRSIHADRASWISLYYINGEWAYSFDNITPVGSTVFRY